MAILLDEYREWNTPVVGAYLLWRFSAGYVNANPRHTPPPFLLHCVVTALLRGRAYSNAIDHSLSLHAFAMRLVKDGYADKLETLHDRVKSFLDYTLQAADMAVYRRMLTWDAESASLVPLKIGKVKRATAELSKSVQRLGNRAERLGKWMGPLELSTIALDLGVKF